MGHSKMAGTVTSTAVVTCEGQMAAWSRREEQEMERAAQASKGAWRGAVKMGGRELL